MYTYKRAGSEGSGRLGCGRGPVDGSGAGHHSQVSIARAGKRSSIQWASAWTFVLLFAGLVHIVAYLKVKKEAEDLTPEERKNIDLGY